LKTIVLFFLLLLNITFAQSLDDLLQEYQDASEKSLHTLDERMGHVVVYSQQDIRRMQYNTLDDILKELPRKNLNKNRYGVNTSTLSGTGTSVSGFFRFFINDHEISSVHTQSSSLTWGNIPLDFVDYVEVYYGESSFSLGNETGIYFIRIYTKKANKTNGGAVVYRVNNHGSNTQNILHSQTLDNGWSYLFFASRNSENDEAKISTKSINNDSKRHHLFLDLSNEATSINIGYSEVKKESYFGLSKDLQSNDGEIQSKDLYVNLSQYFLDDHSLKLNASYDINTRFYEESNDEGLAIVPIRNPYIPVYNISYYTEDLELEKTKLYMSKTASWGNHNMLAGFDYSKKTYKVKNREYTETFIPSSTTTHYSMGHFYDYDEEHTYSLLF
jgi:iron complex outermembrane receptor protein